MHAFPDKTHSLRRYLPFWSCKCKIVLIGERGAGNVHTLHLDLSVAFTKSKLPPKNPNYHIYTCVIIVLALESDCLGSNCGFST